MSVDGRPHLAQARPVIAAGKPLFIDKPMAASLADAMEIFRLAERETRPLFFGLGAAIQLWLPGGATEEIPLRRRERLRGLEPAAPRTAPSRPVLVRHPRRGDVVHDHGPGLPDGDPPCGGQGRRRLGRRPHGDLCRQERLRRRDRGQQGERASRQVSRAINRWWSRSSASSRQAGRRLPPPRRWRSSLSWRPPTKASATTGPP